MTMRSYLLVLAFLALIAFPAAADEPVPPASASVEGVTNVEWPAGISGVAAFGQLVEQRALTLDSTNVRIDSTIPAVFDAGATTTINSTDVIVRSGISTQASFARLNSTDPVQSLVPQQKGVTPIVPASELCGTGYQIGYRKGGKVPSDLLKVADLAITFKTQDDAFTRLRNLIASGIPVMVDVDFFFLFDEAVIQEPGIAAGGKTHESRFIVITGYDANTVTFADNGPTSELGSSGLDITVTNAAFLDAWAATKTLKTGRPVAGPDFMLIVTSKPVLTSPGLTFGYLGVTSAKATKEIDLASKMITSGKDADVILTDADIFAQTRSTMADFADENAQAEIETDYRNSANLWQSIVDSTDSAAIPTALDAIVVLEDAGIAAMQDIGAGAPQIELLGPADNITLPNLDNVAFRWTALPSAGKAVLQIAATGDFTNASRIVKFTPKPGAQSIFMTPKDWNKVIAKANGGTTVKWRVAISGKNIVSDERTLSWQTLQFTLVSPPDGFAVSDATLPTFVWTAPSNAVSPRVVISTTDDFSVKKDTVTIVPKKGQSEVTMTRGQLNQIVNKDDDTTAFWRVEDGGQKTSSVQPSEPRSLLLPE